MSTFSVHYFAAARAAAGVSEEQVTLPDDEGNASLAAVLDYVAETHTGTTQAGKSLADILDNCSILIDGVRADADASVKDAQRIDVLPPFAGG